MQMIKFPLAFDSSGIEKLDEGTNEYYSQLLSISMLTEPGTHPMSPQFGAFDPAFRTIDKSVFILNAAQFVPEVKITNIDIAEQDSASGAIKISVSFDITS